MARAMRPVVVLMLLATVLFIADGILDHNVAGTGGFDDHKGVGWTSYLFAFANLLMTIAVARGSERTLLGRIALSMFFIVERPVTAFVLGPTPIEAIAVHLATAVVELIILVGAIRVWRLGHSLVPAPPARITGRIGRPAANSVIFTSMVDNGGPTPAFTFLL